MKSFGVALATVAFALMAEAGDVHVNPATRMLEDQDGRSVLFHGVNVVYKVDPYIPSMDGEFDSELSLNDEDIQNLVDWGMNFVRLGVMWEGVERVAGVYDEKYLDSVERLINRLGEAGIYTLVDNH
jgi:endoglycosylceramidase